MMSTSRLPEKLAQSHANGIVSSTEALLETKQLMRSFVSKFGNGFSEWWAAESLEKREDFIRDVYPTLVYSTGDRWSRPVESKHGRGHAPGKIYHHRYDRILRLIPEFTVEYLATGDNFPKLVREWTENESLLTKAVELIPVIRSAPGYSVRPIKSGDIGVKLWPAGKKDDASKDLDETAFLNPYIRINDPHTFVHGTGGNPLPDGTVVNLYSMGVFATNDDFIAAMEAMTYLQHLMAVLLDEYKEEVLGRNTKGIARGAMTCTLCGTSGKLLQCSQCGSAFYCSKEHQRQHWKMHKALCEKFKAKPPSAATDSAL